jgi:hypothetical protein
MLTNLPLYASLVENTNNKPILVKHKKTIIKSISEMDNKCKELVYILIKYHQLKSQDEMLYNCVIDTNNYISDVTCDLNELPNQLQQILFKFVEKEQHNQIETQKRYEIEKKMKNSNNLNEENK